MWRQPGVPRKRAMQVLGRVSAPVDAAVRVPRCLQQRKCTRVYNIIYSVYLRR